MNIGMIIALVVIIPVILFPAAFVWYLNLGGLMNALQARKARAAKKVSEGVSS